MIGTTAAEIKHGRVFWKVNKMGRIWGDSMTDCARRFRFGGKKEAAGVCRRRGESMDFESEPADNK
jgi:hypothetical protein